MLLLYLQRATHLLLLNLVLKNIADYMLSNNDFAHRDQKEHREQNDLLSSVADGAVSGIVLAEAFLTFAPTSAVEKSLAIGIAGAGLPQVLSNNSSDNTTTTISAALYISAIITAKHVIKYKAVDIASYLISPGHLMTFCLGGAAAYAAHDVYNNTAFDAMRLAYKASQGCINVAAYEVYDFGEKLPRISGALIEAFDSFLSNVMSYFIHEKVEHEDMVLDVYP
ncbi:MAG: hypothetical protein ACRY3E_05295 [Candidatus Lariskella arthropodorum]